MQAWSDAVAIAIDNVVDHTMLVPLSQAHHNNASYSTRTVDGGAVAAGAASHVSRIIRSSVSQLDVRVVPSFARKSVRGVKAAMCAHRAT